MAVLPVGSDFTIGDYIYRVTFVEVASSTYNVAPRVVDKTKTSYANIPSTVSYGGITYKVNGSSWGESDEESDTIGTFYGCTEMTEAPSIPSTMSTLNGMFNGCTSLRVPPTLPSDAFGFLDCFKNCKSLEQPPSIPDNNYYSSYVGGCFKGCSSLKTAPILPPRVTDLTETFRDCTSLLTAPNIPSTVTKMRNTFRGCGSLTTPPTIPSAVTNMYGCFYDCASLTSAPSIPSNVTDIRWCFRGCTSLTTAPTISHLNVTSVKGLLCLCDKITTAPTIPSTVTEMESFLYGTSISSPPTIPNGATNMKGCFYNCALLVTAPEIPNSVTDITSCFSQCTSLEGIIIVNGNPSENGSAFSNTTNPIFIVDNHTGGSDYWIEVASAYSNVHYRLNDVPSPNATLTAYRVENSGDENQYKTGEYIFVKLVTKYYTDNSPDGTTATPQTPALLFDGQPSSVTWTASSEAGQQVNKAWIPTTDFWQHSLIASQTIHYASGSMLTEDKIVASPQVIVEKLYALINAFHDEDTGTEGIAFGTLSTRTNSMLVAMDAYFKDKADIIRALFDFIHPVGSYYETSDTTFDPNVTWGGTWILETAGQVHVSAGTGYAVSGALTNTSDGGSKDAIVPYHDHEFTNPSIPNHVHTISHSHPTSDTSWPVFVRAKSGGTVTRVNVKNGTGTQVSNVVTSTVSLNSGGTYTGTSSNANSGNPTSLPATTGGSVAYAGTNGNTTNANLQPYIVVNRWHRTA